MLEGIKAARDLGFQAGVVTNGYYATDEADAAIWLKPLRELGIGSLTISDDAYHYGDIKDNPASLTRKAAEKLGIPASVISIEEPVVKPAAGASQGKGEPVVGGTTMFRGRAVEKLAAGLPLRSAEEFTECPHEDLASPQRVHLDCYGNVHLCQGLSMGNFRETRLSKLIRGYDAGSHPVAGPIARGGPAMLAKEYGIKPEEGYIDACHFCYLTRLALMDRFPQYLAPRQVYGLE
jgi:hypothetical protein